MGNLIHFGIRTKQQQSGALAPPLSVSRRVATALRGGAEPCDDCAPDVLEGHELERGGQNRLPELSDHAAEPAVDALEHSGVKTQPSEKRRLQAVVLTEIW